MQPGESEQQYTPQFTPQELLDALPRFRRHFEFKLIYWRIIWLACWAVIMGLLAWVASLNLLEVPPVVCIIAGFYFTAGSLYYSRNFWFRDSKYMREYHENLIQRFGDLSLFKTVLGIQTKQKQHLNATSFLVKNYLNPNPYSLFPKVTSIKEMPKYQAYLFIGLVIVIISALIIYTINYQPHVLIGFIILAIASIPLGHFIPIYAIINAFAFEYHARDHLNQLLSLSENDYNNIVKQYSDIETIRKLHPQYALYIKLIPTSFLRYNITKSFPMGSAGLLLMIMLMIGASNSIAAINVFSIWFIMIAIYVYSTNAYWIRTYKSFSEQLCSKNIVYRMEGELTTKEYMESFQPALVKYSFSGLIRPVMAPIELDEAIGKAGENLEWYFGIPHPISIASWLYVQLPWLVGCLITATFVWASLTITQNPQANPSHFAYILAGCATIFALSRIPSLLQRHKRTAGVSALVDHLWEYISKDE